MDRRRAAGVLLALAACVAYATAAPTASNHTSLDLYDGAPDGCYYNFQHYGEGDRIMTNEPCLNCTCHNRMLMCYLRVCPFTKPIGQDCTIEKRADQCCPIVTCPDVPVDLLTSTTTSPAEYGATGLGRLDKYGCSIHGKYFPEGSKVPPAPNKPCEHCYCIRNMTTCVMQECTLHVDGCTPIYHKDVCCPVRYSCDHPEDEMPYLDDLSTTVRPTPGFLLTTTTLSPVTQMSQDCLYENQIISDGALIKTEKACDHCYCMKGDIVCVVQECGTPMENEGKNCTALAPREGVCCPDTYICEGDEPTTGTYETDYTTESDKFPTLTPPRRAGSEGSGYRNEPDGIPNIETPTFETETEGSGYEQATVHPTVVTEALPDSHKIEPTDEILSSTVEPHGSDVITTTKESDHIVVTSESDVSGTHQYLPSTTSSYISHQFDESSTTKAQDEDIGSGEEDIATYETDSTSSAPEIEQSAPTVASEENIATTKSSEEEEELQTPSKTPTTTAPITDEDEKINVPKEQSPSIEDNAFDLTTRRDSDEDVDVETSTTFDKEYHITEHDLLRTTSIPTVEETDRKTTESLVQDKITFEPHHYSVSTSAPGFEDEIATTEPQDDVTDSFDGTVGDFDIHHQITTSSTPLLEEIEKDTTDQENIPKESTSDEGKPSTTLSDVPTEETIHNESSKPDLIDEIITTNIPTSVPVFEDDAKTTADSHEIKENDFQDSSEPEQFAPTTSAPVFDDETKKTPPSYSLTTSESHEGHKTDVEESSKPHEYASTTIASVFEDATETILTDSMVTSKSQEIDVDSSSEPQSHAPTTSGPVFDDETKKTTPSADIMVTKGPEGPEIADKESSEPQQYTPTTSASTIEYVTKLSTPSDSMTTSKTLGQETGVEESSETLQHIPTTSGPIFDDELKETTSSDASTYSKVQESLETSSESQQYTSPTSGPMFDDESKETTPSKSQEGQETDVKESEKPDQYDSTTSSPVSEDKTITQTPLEVVTTSQIPEDQETGVEESSQQYIPTTSGTVFDDETKDTTPSASTTSKAQEGLETDVKKTSEPEETAPTTSAPVFEDKIKVTTPSDAPTKTPEEQETDLKESSEPELYAPTTIAPVFEDEFKETTSESVTKIQEGEEADVKESSEPEQYLPTTSAPVFEDEAKETTPSGAVTKIEEGQDADVKESSEPEQYAPTTNIPGLEDKIKEITSPDESKMQEGQVTDISRPYQYDSTTIAPVSEDKIQKTTPSDAITTSKIQDGQESDDEKSSEPQQYDLTTKSSTFDDYTEETATSLKQNEVTTAEPDKGLNTIPSGSVDEETTEISEIEKYTHSDETISTELIEDKQSTPDISASQEDQFTLSTESSIKDNVDKLGSTETHGITEQTTVYAEPERITSVVYEELTTTEGPEKYATTTSSPSYATVPESTTADLVENEIINEPRIPGEGDCLLNGVTYRNESSVPSIHKCQSGCRCSSSIIKCDPIICSPPPEYMDNCQTTYDSLDSCCPTYVCDHKTETMPPQSHSQMSGTEAPVESPVKCNGDECILSEDKKQPVETSDECKSGSCTGQAESSSHSDVPEKPVDSDEGCTGDLCKSPDSTDQLCNEENGCQVSPVKPCDGAECQDLPDIPSQQQQPCVGDNCDIPLKDCSLGKCDTADEVKIDIEKECTEESCRRKEDSELEQQPPKKCSGSECQSTELISNVEMTTVDTPDLLTEKVEKSPESPATETDVEVPIENIITDLPDQRVTESDSITEAIFTKSTTETPEEIRTLPPKILTTEQHEVTKLPFDIVEQETTKLSNELDNTYGTEQQTTLPDKPFSEDTATSISEEVFTNPPKTYGTGPLEATDDQTSKPQEDKKPAEKTEDTTTATYDLEDVTKKLQVSEEATTEANIEVGSTTLKSYDLDSQKATKSPLDATTQIIDIMGAETLKPHITDLDEITITPKEPQIEEITGKPTDEFVTQPGDLDIQETTKPPEGSDEITKHYSEKPSTASEEAQSEITTSMEVDVITESPKPSVIDTGIQEVTQFPSESYSEKTTSSSAAEEITTETSKDKSEEDTEQSAATEPSPILETVEQNKTTSLGADEYDADTESSLYDGISHETTVPQDTEQDVTTSKTTYETITESSKLDESELFSTTKSPPGFDIDKTMIMVSTEPPKQEPPSVTQSTEPVAASDTTKSSEEEHKLSSETYSPEESTTSQPERVYDLTTLSTLVSGSKSTDTEKTTIVYEIPTKTLEQSQPTEPVLDSATESIEKATITSHKDVTSIFDHDIIMTELPLDIVTKSETDSEVTPSSDKLSEEGITTVTEIDITSDKTVTELPQVQETKTPYEVKKTTETSTEIDEVTQKPTTISEDNKMQEDVKTEVPILHETEKDVISQETTSKPSDTTIVSYEVDMKTEQPVAIDSHKEQPAETMNETTETTPILEKATKSPMAAETELPVDSEIEPESHTDTPHIHKHEPSKINTSGQDETKTETPLSNELTTVALQDKFTEIIKEPETTESQDISTKPTEYEEETYTKIPAQGSSEAADTGVSHIPEHSDDELTTPGIQVSELTTEPSIVTTESSGPQEKDTEKPAETTQKESLETPVTEQSIVEPTRSTEDRETQTIIPAQESSTEEQVSTEIHRLSTESPKETYTEVFEEDITTAKPVSSDTEKIFEPVTEFVEKVTKDSEIKTPEQEVFEPSQPTTESAEVTKVQEDITVTKDSDSTPVRPSIIETTKIPEATEASLDLEIITGHPGEDIETSSPKHEFSEATTSGKIEDENVPVEKESTEIPVTVSDQQTVEVITEAQPAPTDTATEKQETVTELVEEEIPPSKTERPEILIYQTTSSTFEESAKSTPSPAEEASTESDQTLLTSIESHVTDEDKLATTPVSELDKPSTPKIPEVEVQTETATTPTESPLEPEPSVVTLAPVEEKQTTAKTEEFSTASPLFTKPPYKPTEAPATEHAKPIPSEDQPTDEEITPDEEPSIPPSGTSGYGTDPDYMEEDQTFGPGTCRYGGKVYVSAQQIPRDDPCDFCFCFRSDIICLQQSCPPPIHGCHEEPISGFCCPRYECPVSMATTVNVTTTTTTTTTTLPPHFPVHSYKGSAQKRGCLIKGHTYKVGEVVRASSGPCLHCTCGGDGQMKCDPKQCTPEPMLRQMIAAAVSAKRRR